MLQHRHMHVQCLTPRTDGENVGARGAAWFIKTSSMPNPWSGPASSRPQGSAFHELVVLPTLVPHLARPLPDAPEAQEALVGTSAAERSVSARPDADENDGAEVAAVEAPDRLFFVLVTIHWLKRVQSGRAIKMAKQQDTKQVSAQTPVLRLACAKFVTLALSAHGYKDRYVPGPISGPGMQVYWTGYPGGKANAPTISNDKDWAVSMPPTGISATFDLEAMDGFKTRKRPLSPDGHDSRLEMVSGTRVPLANDYLQETRAIAQAIEAIKAHWDCGLHGGHCYLSADATHVVAEARSPMEPPPQVLLLEWTGTVNTASSSSLSSPNPATTPLTSMTDTNSLLLGLATPLITMAMQQMSSWHPNSPSHCSAAVTHPRSPVTLSCDPRSSPPPPVDDKLRLCLKAFGRAKHLIPDVVARALAGLDDAAYSPDTIDNPTVERLQELTGLPEGQAYQLRRFAAAWSGKIEAKRACHA
ncbi:hypothetical protein BC835DRAFT_1387051 [Cytidiella melzeri]|nr:hypothetical protein BC835DRAFT_1387051 [Cytidiella melzeri]